MPSVATVAQFGSDLVKGALRSTLTQVQKNCSFLNLKQLSKKEKRKQKKLKKKLQRQYGRLENSQSDDNGTSPVKKDALLALKKAKLVQIESASVPELKGKKLVEVEEDSDSESDLSDAVVEDSENWFASNPPLDFVTEGPQVSAFTLSLREKYTCLNTTKKMNSSPNGNARPESPTSNDNNSKDIQNSNSNSSATSVTYGTVEEAPNSPVLQQQQQRSSDSTVSSSSSKVSVTNGHEKGSSTSEVSKLNGESKESNKNSIANGQLPPSKKLIQSNLTGFVTKAAPALANRTPNGPKSEEKPTVSLPEPRVVLYERNKIKAGWRLRLPIGVGFINLGNTCYMNATLQVLFHTPAFFNWLLDELNSEEHKKKCQRNGQFFHQCTVCPMVSTVLGAYNKTSAPMRPVQIHNKLKTIGKNFGYGRQEDAHEFLRLLLESMERSYLSAAGGLRLDNRSKETTPLGQIFGGYTRGEVRCLTCRHVSTTFHPHAELQLDIREVNNVEDALAFYFQKERLDNNDYKCERCKTVQPATKQQFMELAPIVLCIQLKRFRACGSKIKKPIFVNERLNLRRFMHNPNDERCRAAEYKLVGLVTHMGPSPNCGHYTAIAQAQNGNYYHFDDSYVRMTNLNYAQNADAYVIIYETTDPKLLSKSSSTSISPTSKISTPSSTSSSSSTSSTPSAALSSTATAPTANKFIGPQLPPGMLAKSSSTATTTSSTTSPTSTSTQHPATQASENHITPKKPMNNLVSSSSPGPKLVSSSMQKPFGPNSPLAKPNRPGLTNGLASKTSFTIPKTSHLGTPAKIFQAKSPLARAPYDVNRTSNGNNRIGNSNQQQKSSSSLGTKLVDYGDSDEEDTATTGQQNGSPKSVKKENGNAGETNSSSKGTDGDEAKKTYGPPSPGVKIKSWSGDEESKLGKALELDRKRPFVKTKEEIEDEEIDSGRQTKKKAKSHSPENTPHHHHQHYPKENPFDKHSSQ